MIENEKLKQEEEIADAQWFTTDNLPAIPPPVSIARALTVDPQLIVADEAVSMVDVSIDSRLTTAEAPSSNVHSSGT